MGCHREIQHFKCCHWIRIESICAVHDQSSFTNSMLKVIELENMKNLDPIMWIVVNAEAKKY